MSLDARVSKLERADRETSGPSGTATVLVTDADGADFLATAEGEGYGYGDALVITTGIFTDHKFSGGLTADDETAIAKLDEVYKIVAVSKIDGYHLRLIDKAYKAALARQANKLA